jgi:hypothetical protein
MARAGLRPGFWVREIKPASLKARRAWRAARSSRPALHPISATLQLDFRGYRLRRNRAAIATMRPEPERRAAIETQENGIGPEWHVLKV